MKASPLPAPGGAAGRQVAQEGRGEPPGRIEMDDAGAVGAGHGDAALGRELQQGLVAGDADRPRFGEAAGQDQDVADAAVGAFADRIENGVGADDDDGEIDRRIDGADRGHCVVTEDRAALGIDRHDLSAVTGAGAGAA